MRFNGSIKSSSRQEHMDISYEWIIGIKIFLTWLILGLSSLFLFKRNYYLGLLLSIVVTAVIYFSLVDKYIGTGDPGNYATLIENNEIGKMPVHWGYLAFGWIVHQLFDYPIDYTLNITQVFLSILTVAILYALTFHFTKNVTVAVLITIGYGTCMYVIYNAVFSEKYVLQALAGFTALFLYYKDRAFISGVIFSYSMMISVTNFALLPCFLLPGTTKRKLIYAILGMAISFGLFLAFFWKGFLFGPGYRAIFSPSTLQEMSGRFVDIKERLPVAKILFGGQPALFPLFLVMAYEQIRNRQWQLKWMLPIFASIVLHLCLGGLEHQWGFDLIVLPLFFVPLAIGLVRFADRSFAHVIFLIAISLNFIAGLWIWLERPIFSEPAILGKAYAKMGELYGNPAPLGFFDRTSMYLRANHLPFDYKEDPFNHSKIFYKEGNNGPYLILNESVLSEYKVKDAQKVVVDGVEAWLWKTPQDQKINK